MNNQSLSSTSMTMLSIYKIFNIITLGGILVYAYILSFIQQDDSLAPAASSAFTNPGSEHRSRKLRPNSPSSSLWIPPKNANGPIINHRRGKATTINLIGERHSGTNWITNHLVDCFGDQVQVGYFAAAPNIVIDSISIVEQMH